jgi:hypothetical protein
MMFKIADMAHEAQLVEIADQLSEAVSGEAPVGKALDLNRLYRRRQGYASRIHRKTKGRPLSPANSFHR